MIKAIIFDLDGTLVQTEPLKSLAYARAAVQLSSNTLSEEAVMEACHDLVGISDPETALALMQRFELEDAVRARMAEMGVDAPWQALLQIQTSIYNQLLDDPEALRSEQLPHSLALLHEVRQKGYKTALATLSFRDQTRRVLDVLGLTGEFDFIATQDDVERGKPDPEIYLFVARGLAILPIECLVIEDSLAGVQAALAAGMWCIAVPTPFTSQTVRAAQVLDERWIVDDPADLRTVVQQMLAERERDLKEQHGIGDDRFR